MARILSAVCLLSLIACAKNPTGSSDASTVAFDFARSAEGWVAGFAFYQLESEDATQLVAEYRQLPPPLDQTRGGLFISGNNTSDALFMFWKRRVTGLQPARAYAVEFIVEFATNVAKGVGGVGGSPDSSVHVRAGASSAEPVVVLVGGPVGIGCPSTSIVSVRSSERLAVLPQAVPSPSNWYCPSIDVDRNTVILGTAGNLSGTPTWEVKELRSGPTQLVVTSGQDGSVWLLVGTTSGFEGVTSLYYTRFVAHFTPL